MKTIYKYELDMEENQKIELPSGAEVLSAGQQGRGIVVWAWVDKDAPRKWNRFRIAGTGHSLPAWPGRFVGTVHDSPLVWHVFHAGEVE